MAKGAAYETSYCRRGLFGGHYIHLTDLGRDVAEKIYERHCFFTKHFISIGVDPETAEADACRIEHDISAETYERLKESITKE